MLIAGGRVIDPAGGVDAMLDVRIEGTVVSEFGERLAPHSGEEVIDATNCYVAPGFIDMHVHLREPGNPEKETIASGVAAAAAGGFTAVACMPNTSPAADTPDVLAEIGRKAACASLARVHPIGAVTLGRAGRMPVDFDALAGAGAVAFSDDGSTIMDAGVLREAALAALNVPGCFISHAEDEHLKGDAVMNEGRVSSALHLPGSPSVAEHVIVARDLLIARETRKAWHIAHLSTRTALELLRWARTMGATVSAEVTPHHLLLTDEAVRRLHGHAKVNPPLRTERDVEALLAGVRDGSIDAFATDHAPHTAAEKDADLRTAAVGFSGLETALGAYALAVPDLPVRRFVELLSTNPARILGVQGGALSLGAPADVTIFADRAWTVDPHAFYSKGKCTPFAGMTFPRRAVATIVDGRLVMSGGRVLTEAA